MGEIALRAEHIEEITWYATEFQAMEPKIADAQARFDNARRKVEAMKAAMARTHSLGLTIDEHGVLRQAEMLAYFLSEARRADEELALFHNMLAVLREALSLFLIDAYNLDPKTQWTLNIEKGVLHFDAAQPTQP